MMKYLQLLILALLLIGSANLNAQRPIKGTLLDGNKVTLYPQRTLDNTNKGMRYAPFNLRVSERAGNKEFSFLAYRQDSTSAILGGILHFLLTWGPTDVQERELADLLRMRSDSSTYLAGSLPMEIDTTVARLEVGPPDHPLAQVLIRSLRSVGTPPLRPGSKMAASFKFSAEDAEVMVATLKTPEDWKEVYLRIHLTPFDKGVQSALPTQFILTKSFASCIEF